MRTPQYKAKKKRDSGLSIEGCHSRIPRLVNPRKHPYIKLTGQVSSLYFESLVCRCRKRISCAEE